VEIVVEAVEETAIVIAASTVPDARSCIPTP
jgi:hypothetical protein